MLVFVYTPEPKPWFKQIYTCIYAINEVFLKYFVINADNKIMWKKRGFTPYQINNVLRVYGEQLRRGRIYNRQRSAANSPDKISISAKARRDSIVEDITSNIVEKISHLVDPHKNIESEHGKSLLNNEARHDKLIFKEINENGETVNLFSLEDAKFLSNESKPQKR